MISLISSCLLMALLPFSFTLLVDICLGYPAKEESLDVRAIFFGFSLWLAERRLKSLGMFYDNYNNFKEGLSSTNPLIKKITEASYKQATFTLARQYFSWELGLGMCPVCTGVRFSILFSLLCILKFGFPWGAVLIVPCFSSLYILLFNKLKN